MLQLFSLLSKLKYLTTKICITSRPLYSNISQKTPVNNTAIVISGFSSQSLYFSYKSPQSYFLSFLFQLFLSFSMQCRLIIGILVISICRAVFSAVSFTVSFPHHFHRNFITLTHTKKNKGQIYCREIVILSDLISRRPVMFICQVDYTFCDNSKAGVVNCGKVKPGNNYWSVNIINLLLLNCVSLRSVVHIFPPNANILLTLEDVMSYDLCILIVIF